MAFKVSFERRVLPWLRDRLCPSEVYSLDRLHGSESVRSKTIKPESEGHIYDVLNMSLVVPWRRTE